MVFGIFPVPNLPHLVQLHQPFQQHHGAGCAHPQQRLQFAVSCLGYLLDRLRCLLLRGGQCGAFRCMVRTVPLHRTSIFLRQSSMNVRRNNPKGTLYTFKARLNGVPLITVQNLFRSGPLGLDEIQVVK